jgi:diketogulonate reductase-like aldo/keto reductase
VSLNNLRTTYIDSYLLHSPLNTIERTLEAWKVLMKLQDNGIVSLIGVSNTYDVETLKTLETQGGRRPNVVQNRWHEGNGFDKEVVRYCKENSIYYEWVYSCSQMIYTSFHLTGFW